MPYIGLTIFLLTIAALVALRLVVVRGPWLRVVDMTRAMRDLPDASNVGFGARLARLPSGLFMSWVMQVVVTVAAGGASLYIILSRHYDSDSEKWAFGTIGAILGFWLKSPSVG